MSSVSSITFVNCVMNIRNDRQRYRLIDRDTDRQMKFTDTMFMWGSLRLTPINFDIAVVAILLLNKRLLICVKQLEHSRIPDMLVMFLLLRLRLCETQS